MRVIERGARRAYLDERYEPGPRWDEAAFESPGTVGGRVLPGENHGWAQWVYYVVEYGWKPRLAAGNIAVDAAAGPPDPFDPGPGRLDPRMDVRLVRAPAFPAYLRERYRFSRDWGARRVPRWAAPLRLALPLLVLVRTPWWRRPATLPGVVVISLVMAAGEIAGSLRGRNATVNV